MAQNFVFQSTLRCAIIMDGNGRWALARGLPRVAGHQAGAQAVRRIVEAAPEFGIGILTLFAFSADNWRRPPAEVDALMTLLGDFLHSETGRCVDHGVRLEVIGRRDRLQTALSRAVTHAERLTAPGTRLRLRLAVDYSGREAIMAAVRQLPEPSREALAHTLGPPVDLLIRTGGEQRLSDFLLWESAYAELIFSRRMWPDFTSADLAGAVREFRFRERRFGGVPAPALARKSGASSAWLE
jgi:undecaprenyl diphosphate synthase